MKEDLSFLNDIDIDDSEIEEMELCELTANKIKKDVMKKVKKEKFKKKNIIAASICFGVICITGIVGVVNPAYAANIPIVSDIFKFIDDQYGHTGAYDKYKENSSKIDITKESNGIEITIKDAVFDGKTISYTYELKTDKDLGENPFVSEARNVKIEGYTGSVGGSSDCEKVTENIYVGNDQYTIDEEMKKINVKLNLDTIFIFEENRNEKIKGEWNFNFNLKATKNKMQVVNKSIEKDGFKIRIEGILRTPMSTVIEYMQEGESEELNNKWDFIQPNIEVKDDLGNVYKKTGVSGTGENGVMHYTQNIGIIDTNATKLIITPKLDLFNQGKEIEKEENGVLEKFTVPVDEDHPIHGEEILDDIIVDLEK